MMSMRALKARNVKTGHLIQYPGGQVHMVLFTKKRRHSVQLVVGLGPDGNNKTFSFENDEIVYVEA